jgi:copper homeostasis protein
LLIEVCVDSVEGALAAEQGGADRVELCADLLEGGLTPSAGAIELARSRLAIGLHILIRPRGGDFLYTDLEWDVMRKDVETAKRLGAEGVVSGFLDAQGNVDLERTRRILELARPASVTFHRAFDMARDPLDALEKLIALGVDRVLTSGQENSALAGIDLLAKLVGAAGDRIIVMPAAGGLDDRHVAKVVETTGAREIHVTALRTIESAMSFRNSRCFMGGELRPPEFSWSVTDASRVAALRDRLRRP